MHSNHVDGATPRVLTPARLALALAAALALSACGGDEPAEPAAAPATEAAAPAAAEAPAAAPVEAPAEPEPAVTDALAAMSEEDLRTAASQALRDQRLYAPAGDNAIAYYLALRERVPNDAGVNGALVDLFPYALIAAEQAIARNELDEARRLYALMSAADASAPALPRIQASIDRAETEATRRLEQEEERRLAAEAAAAAAAQAAATAAAAPPPAPEPEPTPAPAAVEPEPEPEPAPVVAAPPPTPPPAPTRAPGQLPRAISTPQPTYPAAAYRRGLQGEVEFEFTVAADGSVSDVRVLRSEPRGAFDREVINTVRRWRFEPPGEPVTGRRTIGFSMNDQ